jgi:hypothetical protein
MSPLSPHGFAMGQKLSTDDPPASINERPFCCSGTPDKQKQSENEKTFWPDSCRGGVHSPDPLLMANVGSHRPEGEQREPPVR